jgi:hypothetical protein
LGDSRPESLPTAPTTAAFSRQERRTRDAGSQLANLVIVDRNPLEGYRNLLHAKVVIDGGEVVVDTRQ